MKKLFLPIVLLAALTGFLGGAYAAEVSTSLDVSTTIGVVCSVQTQGVVFPWAGPLEDSFAQGDVTVTCPLNTGYNIAFDAGQNLNFDPFNEGLRALAGPDPEGLGYFLLQPDGITEWGDSDFLGTYLGGTSLADTGNGAPQPHTVNGILLSAGRLPSDGEFADIVGVTVYF